MFNLFKKPTVIEKPKTLGQLGEEFAQKIYEEKGYEILGANVFNKKGLRKGEIDFIAKNKTEIVFVEVKTRANVETGKFGSAAESVNMFKQAKFLRAVKLYLLSNPQYQDLRPRIDVCLVEQSRVDYSLKCAKIIANAVEDWS